MNLVILFAIKYFRPNLLAHKFNIKEPQSCIVVILSERSKLQTSTLKN